MASGPITSWQIDGEKVETVADFIFVAHGHFCLANAVCSTSGCPWESAWAKRRPGSGIGDQLPARQVTQGSYLLFLDLLGYLAQRRARA